jgi:hypothetical protein
MDCLIVCPIASIVCFLVAIIFFRKKGKSAIKFSFRFIFSSVFPGRMKDHLKPGGVVLVILGYVLFFICIFIVEGTKYFFAF